MAAVVTWLAVFAVGCLIVGGAILYLVFFRGSKVKECDGRNCPYCESADIFLAELVTDNHKRVEVYECKRCHRSSTRKDNR